VRVPLPASSRLDARYLSAEPVMGIGVVDASRAHVVELLTWAWTWTWNAVGQVDDVEDLWAAEAGDLHSSHGVRLGVRSVRHRARSGTAPCGRAGHAAT
jgi:hypothetical protein